MGSSEPVLPLSPDGTDRLPRRALLSLVAIAGAVLLAVFAQTPPRPLPGDAPASEFSAGRAMADVRETARAPHPTGSAENARVRDYLAGRLRALGMSVLTREAPLGERARKRLSAWQGSDVGDLQAINLIGVLEGRDPAKPAVLLMAHHDSVWASPGAADDDAGVAAILETVRALGTEGQPERTLMVLFTDAEELALDGAEHFFRHDPLRERVGVIVNLEARGSGGRALLFETGYDNGAMMDLFAAAVRRPVGNSTSVFIYNQMPNATDYTVAKELGVPGFNFGFADSAEFYHSPMATPDSLDAGSVQDIGRQTLDLSRALLAAPELPGKSPDRVFFDLFGLVFFNYAGALGWLIVALAAGAYVYAGWGVTSLRDFGRGSAIVLSTLAVGGLLLYAGNWVSGANDPVNYYDRLAAIPLLGVQAALLCVATLLLVAGLLRNDRPVAALLPGIAAPLLLLAALTQAAAPPAAYGFYLPLLLAGIGAAAGRLRPGAVSSWTTALMAMIGLGLLFVSGYAVMLSVGPDAPYTLALTLAFCLPLLAPLCDSPPRGRATRLAAIPILLAVAVALWVRLDPVAVTVPPFSSFH